LSSNYNAATKKLQMTGEEAKETIRDLSCWKIHRPSHADIVNAIGLQRRYRL